LNTFEFKGTPVEKTSHGKIIVVPVVQLRLWSKGVSLDKNLPCTLRTIFGLWSLIFLTTSFWPLKEYLILIHIKFPNNRYITGPFRIWNPNSVFGLWGLIFFIFTLNSVYLFIYIKFPIDGYITWPESDWLCIFWWDFFSRGPWNKKLLLKQKSSPKKIRIIKDNCCCPNRKFPQIKLTYKKKRSWWWGAPDCLRGPQTRRARGTFPTSLYGQYIISHDHTNFGTQIPFLVFGGLFSPFWLLNVYIFLIYTKFPIDWWVIWPILFFSLPVPSLGILGINI
jgi:hypothetical protein